LWDQNSAKARIVWEEKLRASRRAAAAKKEEKRAHKAKANRTLVKKSGEEMAWQVALTKARVHA